MLRVVEMSFVLVAVIMSMIMSVLMIVTMSMAVFVIVLGFVIIVPFVVMARLVVIVGMLMTMIVIVMMPASVIVFLFLCHFLNPRCFSPYPLLFTPHPSLLTPYSLLSRCHHVHDLPLLVGHLHDRKTGIAHEIESFQFRMSLHLSKCYRPRQGSHRLDIDDQQLWIAL